MKRGRVPCNLPWATTPHALTYARRYLTGWRCLAHSPAAEAGRPEPPEGQGWPPGARQGLSPLGTSGLFDARAVASGKRRSSPHTYRAAQAAVNRRDPAA